MVLRDFDKEIDKETPERVDPIQFKLFGRKWDCRDDANGKLLMDRAADMESDSLELQRDGVVGIFQMIVVTDQIEELLDYLDDPDTKIQLAKLVEIIGWLVEQYGERPTEPPAPSPRGRRTSARTSPARRPAKASTSRPTPSATT